MKYKKETNQSDRKSKRKNGNGFAVHRTVFFFRKQVETYRTMLLRERNRKRRNRELADAVSFLRNAVSSSFLPSQEIVLTELSSRNWMISEGFAAMLSRLRQNDEEEAVLAFIPYGGEKEGADIARLLIKWDRLEASELMETLRSYQHHLSEMRYTERRKQDELISDILYLPVVMNVMLVFINFIYVGYFLDQQEMFNILF